MTNAPLDRAKLAEKQIVAAAMKGYRRILRYFPSVLQRTSEPLWKACKELDRARKMRR